MEQAGTFFQATHTKKESKKPIGQDSLSRTQAVV